MELLVKKLSPTATLPVRGSRDAVGYDLAADCGGTHEANTIVVRAGTHRKISTNIAVSIPGGFYGRVAPRSGLAVKHGIDVLAGVVDPDYRGDVAVVLINHGKEDFYVTHGMRIAQLVLERVATPDVVEVETLAETVRGTGGFGSTGV